MEERESNKSERRIKDADDIKTMSSVLDKKTVCILQKLKKQGLLKEVHGAVSTGKEASIYFGIASSRIQSKMCRKEEKEGENEEEKDIPVAIKIYKTSTMVFKDRERYIIGERRFKRYCKGNSRKLVQIWAEKEARNLNRLQKANIPAPRALFLRRNILIMTMIGDSAAVEKARESDAEGNRDAMEVSGDWNVSSSEDYGSSIGSDKEASSDVDNELESDKSSGGTDSSAESCSGYESEEYESRSSAEEEYGCADLFTNGAESALRKGARTYHELEHVELDSRSSAECSDADSGSIIEGVDGDTSSIEKRRAAISSSETRTDSYSRGFEDSENCFEYESCESISKDALIKPGDALRIEDQSEEMCVSMGLMKVSEEASAKIACAEAVFGKALGKPQKHRKICDENVEDAEVEDEREECADAMCFNDGRVGGTAPNLKTAKLTGEMLRDAYGQVVSLMKRIYGECGLIHSDLSEYNLLYWKGTVYVLDVGQSVERDHPNALEFLKMDVENITAYFSRLGVETEPAESLFKSILAQENVREARGRRGSARKEDADEHREESPCEITKEEKKEQKKQTKEKNRERRSKKIPKKEKKKLARKIQIEKRR